MRKSRIYNKSAITLVELMIVMIIIGILSATVIILFSGGTDKAKNAVRDTDMRGIVSSARAIRVNEGDYPIKPSAFRTMATDYISEIPSDPDSGKIMGSLDEPLPSYDTQEYTYAYYDSPIIYSDDRIMASTHFTGINGNEDSENQYYGRYMIGTMWGPTSQEMWTQGVPYSIAQTNAGTILLDDH